jgi:uncharacterized protein (TIGR03067 family)
MRRTFVVGLAIVLAGFSVAEDKKEAALDVAKLEGTWEIKSGEKSGQKISDEGLKSKPKITKDKLVMGEGDMVFEFKITIDAKAKPATIDMEMTKSPFGAGMKAKGIIALEGDELKLCYNPTDGDRPTKFDGAKAHYFVMKKAK